MNKIIEITVDPQGQTKATDYWRGLTLPFPEPGLRLIKQEKVAEFDRTLT